MSNTVVSSASGRAIIAKKGRTASGVVDFLRGAFLRGHCQRVELRQRTTQGAPRVRDWTILDLDPSERTPEWLADAIVDTAQDDADNQRGGSCAYGVLVYRAEENEPWARHLITMQGDGGFTSGDVLAETEPPNATGLVSQAQRHLENMAKVTMGSISQVMQYQGTMIRTLADKIDQYAEREERDRVRREELSQADHERKLELLRERKSDERKDRILDKLETLLPAVVTKLAPKDGKPVAILDSMRQVMKTLSPAQFETIMKTLQPEQAIALGGIYQAFLVEEMGKESAKEAETKEEAAQ